LDLIAIYETRRQRCMMYVEGAAVIRVTIAISSRLLMYRRPSLQAVCLTFSHSVSDL